MARVLIATQSWSPITRNALGVLQIQATTSVTIANTDGTAATTWSAQTGGSSSTAAQLTDSNGNIQRWIEEGEYDLTVAGTTLRVEASKGGPLLHGTGTPSASLGKDGDFYVDDTNHLLYGPKSGPSWGVGYAFGGETISIAGGLRGELAPADDPAQWANSTRTLASANRAFAVRWVPKRAWGLTLAAWVVGNGAGAGAASANDPCEVAIYNTTTRLVTTGAQTGKLNALGVQTASLALSPDPGTVYYVVFRGEFAAGTGATLVSRSCTDAAELNAFGTSAPDVLGFAWDVGVAGTLLPSTLPTSSFVAGIATFPKIWLREV